MYEGFANVYDQVMNHIPYEQWFERLKGYLAEHGTTSGTICELGCGTGIMTELFAGAGFHMIGVDKSSDMLALAAVRKEQSGSGILYLEQNMEELELAEPVDAVISVCDSLNYLLQEDALNAVFQKVYKNLKPNGYFIFDMKTAYCYRNIIGNQTWVEQDEDVSYIWENYYYEESDINEYMLTIFKKQPESGLYERIEEAHYQRAYTVDDLKMFLEQNGFEVTDCFNETMSEKPAADSERVYIAARKKE